MDNQFGGLLTSCSEVRALRVSRRPWERVGPPAPWVSEGAERTPIYPSPFSCYYESGSECQEAFGKPYEGPIGPQGRAQREDGNARIPHATACTGAARLSALAKAPIIGELAQQPDGHAPPAVRSVHRGRRSLPSNTGPSTQANLHPRRAATAHAPHTPKPHGIGPATKT